MDKLKYIRYLILNLTCLLIPIAGFAAEWPELRSKIPGVYVISLETRSEDDYPSADISDSEHELVNHCAAEKTVYVLGVSSQTKCRHKSELGGNRISVMLRKDKATHGFVTISTRGFPPQTFKREALLARDKELIESVLSSRRTKLRKEEDAELKEAIARGWTTQENHSAWMNEMMSTPEFKRKRSPGAKIQTSRSVFVVAEVGLRTNALGWDFRYAIFDTTRGTPQFLGEIEGCINDFADIDGDGVPEVRTSSCDNTEATIETYWSLIELGPVVTWEQS